MRAGCRAGLILRLLLTVTATFLPLRHTPDARVSCSAHLLLTKVIRVRALASSPRNSRSIVLIPRGSDGHLTTPRPRAMASYAPPASARNVSPPGTVFAHSAVTVRHFRC